VVRHHIIVKPFKAELQNIWLLKARPDKKRSRLLWVECNAIVHGISLCIKTV
jgi:hypothetical protein